MRTVTGVILLGVLFLALGGKPYANVGVTVSPLITEMQAGPGQVAHQTVRVSNLGSDAEQIVIRPVDWRTLSDGSVHIERVGAEGASSLTRYLSLSAYQFTLQIGETRDLDMTLALPQAFSTVARSYWGGYLLKATSVRGSQLDIGPGATIFVYNDVGAPKRHLSLKSLQVVQKTPGNAVVFARLRNDGNAYLRMASTLFVEQGGRIFKKQSVPVATMFPGSTRVLNIPLTGLPPGTYKIDLTFDFGEAAVVEGSATARIR